MRMNYRDLFANASLSCLPTPSPWTCFRVLLLRRWN